MNHTRYEFGPIAIGEHSFAAKPSFAQPEIERKGEAETQEAAIEENSAPGVEVTWTKPARQDQNEEREYGGDGFDGLGRIDITDGNIVEGEFFLSVPLSEKFRGLETENVLPPSNLFACPEKTSNSH